MTRESAVRAARTACTNAENAGRQGTFVAAEKMGIQLRKRWVATKDSRTRHEHGMADGQTVPANEPFIVGGEEMMFPADTAGSPWNVYNCRCAMRTVEKPGIEAEPRQIRVRDPVTGKNVVVSDMTYSEWLDWKENLEKSAKSGIISQPMNLQLFAEQDLKKQTTKSLEKGIRSLDKRIQVHEDKILHPEKYNPKWESFDDDHKEGLKKHWEKEITNFEESKNNRIEELKRRGK